MLGSLEAKSGSLVAGEEAEGVDLFYRKTWWVDVAVFQPPVFVPGGRVL
jgi:hypothetical protein